MGNVQSVCTDKEICILIFNSASADWLVKYFSFGAYENAKASPAIGIHVCLVDVLFPHLPQLGSLLIVTVSITTS